MLRRTFVKSAGLLAGFLSIPIINLKAENQVKKITFRHVVYFWLNNPEVASEKSEFLTNLKTFIGDMDNIMDAHIGVPAETPREVVDNTYQYCLNLGFENKKQHDIYQDHALHKKFIEKSSHLWKRVLVYDSVSV